MKYRKAVFIVTYAKTKKGIEFLILKRKLHWKGWEFPKGGVDFLETKRAAVKRELHEETGLSPLGKIKKFDFFGKYLYGKELHDRPKFRGQTFTLYAVRVKKSRVRLDSREHSDSKWVSYREAVKKLKWSDQKKALKIVKKWLDKSE